MTSHGGLDIEYVSGRGNVGLGRVASIINSDAGHAWNVVKLNGYWYSVDSTWDAGGVNEQKTEFTRNTRGYKYFLSSPNRFSEEHKAKEPNKNLLNDVEMNPSDLIWSDLLDGQSFTDFIRSKLHTLSSKF